MTTITMPKLHPSQENIRTTDARFAVLACGRRWGKTRLGSALCIAAALQGGRSWWVAPSYKVAAVGWRVIRQLAVQIPGAQVAKVERMIELPTGGSVQVRSADDPDSLRGEGLDFLVMDECAFVKEAAWNEALRPSLSDRKGRALFISTPAGQNWFWRIWNAGQDEMQDEIRSFRFPTVDNPYIDPAEIEAARKSLPDRIFRQEYLAEFIDDAGGVFRRVMDAATADPQDVPIEGHEYVFGVDWARSNDYTVFTVIDLTEKAQVYSDRFSQIDYNTQVSRLTALYNRFNPRTIIAEYNSMGGPLVERLQADGLPVQSFTTTNATKAQVIDALALAFERGDIRILSDPVFIGELQAFEGKQLLTGIRYSAPEGMHDDCVISLALAWHGCSHGVQVVQDPFAAW